ncbi:MAG: substrate-binding domain-containing protein [Spirochaetales bacterium]|nr:substrate-binding domain-containing protein [Spirochaetales bacterium]
MKKKGKKSHYPVFGVVSSWFRGQYQHALVSGIEYEAKRKGARVLYFAGRCLHSPDPYDAFQNIVYDIIPIQSLDGLIITGLLANYCTDNQMRDFIHRYSALPVITIDYKIPGIPGILLHNEQGLMKLLTHLVKDHGYGKIAFICGSTGNLDAQQRLMIYKNTLTSCNLPVHQELIIPGDFSYLSGRKAVNTLCIEKGLKPGTDIDAIVASNDLMALGAMDELSLLGIKVPEDIAVTGFDDSLDAGVTSYSLTTVRQPVFSIGKKAIDSLIDYSSAKQETYFDTELVIRNSCGCRIHTRKSMYTDKRKMLYDEPDISSVISNEREMDFGSGEKISEFYMYQLIYVSDALKQVRTLDELESWMHEGFVSLGLHECYLFLYNSTLKIPGEYSLVAGYNRKGKISTSEKINYTDATLFGTLLLSEYQSSHCLLPVLFRENQFGFLLLGVNIKSWIAYETLRSQVSASLKNIFLINEIQKINKELEKANMELKQADKQKTNFFINIAHETKTPLTLIKNYLEKYMQECGPNDDLFIIKNNIEILLENMVNFLDVEKIEKGKILYNHQQLIQLSLMIENKVIMFREIAKKKNIRITSAVEERIFIRADPWAVDRILNNLMDNAIKYTQVSGRINVTLVRNAGHVLLSVDDNGPGIEQDKINHIYQPYYQLSGEIKSSQGIGMGLYIVKKIIDELKGSITVKSKKEKGTCFVISLKESAGNETDSILKNREWEQSYLSSATLPGKMSVIKPLKEELISPDKSTLLIVDDNHAMLSFLQSALKEKYNVFMASNVKEALIKLEKIPKPEIIVSDIMMDGMDGYEFLTSLTAVKEFSDIPFIFLTAKHTEEERLRGLSAGAIDFIEKPFSVKALKNKIESIISLGKKQRKREAAKMKMKIDSLFGDYEQTKIDSKYHKFEKDCLAFRITHREKDILACILKGLANKEIAAALNITRRTVEFHITNIYKKCGVGDRFELLTRFKTTD